MRPPRRARAALLALTLTLAVATWMGQHPLYACTDAEELFAFLRRMFGGSEASKEEDPCHTGS